MILNAIREACAPVCSAVFPSAKGRSAKAILVTSPEFREGRSTVALGLAVTIAQTGARTLIIDADSANPGQHARLGVGAGPGLSDVLTGRTTFSEAIHSTAVTGLDLLPTGNDSSILSDTIGKERWSQLIGLLSLTYDHILIDAPAMLGAVENPTVATCCDAAVVVLRANHSTCRAAATTTAMLRQAGTEIAGLIINRAG
jgi:capsular exopolysaccharide synthesis family protein